ncbi:TIGR03118 family protein [Paraburkholderia aromaticivorans]|uniref:TIGR03118 family protein n=1 Tax=Paraburkholderia aromaticivorans TaxID=2026199 RepID=A0A248VPX9_9BURK|nr:TIGR03118 family protein [Paraburkholderia aromaticivorans]ASW01051.1 TIGR03118 family protein [Paraburkholderia aromaticivorans]
MNSVLKALSAVVGGAALVSLVAACGGSDSVSMQSYTSTALVSDGAVAAAHTDPHLKNAWGVAFNPKGFVWVADNATSVATLYDGNGTPQSLVVSIPNGTNGPANPTGIVFNGTTDFVVTQGGKSGVGAFIFAGEGGTITAWAPTVGPTTAFVVFDNGSSGAVYKGLALASNGGANFLYAADFHNNRIDVFDKSFAKVLTPGKFQDASIPAGFAPFGIQAIGAKLFVTYAKQDAQAHDNVDGAGLGFVDIFDTAGNLLQRFASAGALNAPWGVTQAPANFGRFSGDVLVGNFGDGTINAFDPVSGQSLGAINLPDGSPFVQHGLWGIAFGNGLSNQPVNTLFFAAGPNDEADGVYGRIDVKM